MNKKIKANIKHIRISPFKLRRIANLLRKKNINEAFLILDSLPHKGAMILKKALNSVKYNAIKNNHEIANGVNTYKNKLVTKTVADSAAESEYMAVWQYTQQ